MDDKKTYHDIITSIWKLLKANLDVINDINDANDPRWRTIVNDFLNIERNAPQHLKKYAGDMVLLHVDELERRWRK